MSHGHEIKVPQEEVLAFLKGFYAGRRSLRLAPTCACPTCSIHVEGQKTIERERFEKERRAEIAQERSEQARERERIEACDSAQEWEARGYPEDQARALAEKARREADSNRPRLPDETGNESNLP